VPLALCEGPNGTGKPGLRDRWTGRLAGVLAGVPNFGLDFAWATAGNLKR